MSHNHQSPNLETKGRKQAEPPKWVNRLGNLISRAFHSEEVLAPVGCHFHQEGEGTDIQTEVTLFVSSTEFYGGAFDGRVKSSPFMLDLRDVMDTFDLIESFYWQSHKMADDDQVGPHIGVEGVFEGHRVWLRVTADPPTQFESGRVANFCTNEFETRW